jgi:hypothetical protein
MSERKARTFRTNFLRNFFILWRIDTTTTVSGQRLGKHVPSATNAHATIELLLETG